MTAVTSTSKAEVTLPSDTEILITREFAAPRHLVYRAWTTPELIKRWWAGDNGEVTSVEVDLRVGGGWRYVMTATAGWEVGFHGEYQEIVTNERIVSTNVFEGVPTESALSTLTLTETGGRTTLRLLTLHTSKQNRDMEIQSGMESGVQSSWAMLEEVAVSLA
jgi:uncharacterized protein YndB with AHSA1/START domain